MSIRVVILAAGRGKRMQSQLPKVLHPLAGKPLLQHVIDTVLKTVPDTSPIVVYGHQGELIQRAFSHYPIAWVYQKEQLGTGHALQQILPLIEAEDKIVVLYGDVPLISEATLSRLITETPSAAIGLLTVELANPTGYGRIKRDAQQRIMGIVEEKDATAKERKITEVNPGIYFIPGAYLKKWLPQLSNQNAQGEYYLTDIISFSLQENIPIQTLNPTSFEEVMGVNDRAQLAELERFYQAQLAKQLMLNGVTIFDPARLDVRGELTTGSDVVIDVNVIIEGRVNIGNNCFIGPNTLLRNTSLGNNVEIKANSVIEAAEIGDGCVIGPFARIRPDTTLAAHVHIGNFVEVKNSKINENSKVNHLSYVGDSHVGKRVNIGAGTITCNYDGANKSQTIIGDDVHIGSDTQLIAPVKIGDGATIGAGSTIVKDVPAHELTITHRLEQRSVKNWKRPVKSKEVS